TYGHQAGDVCLREVAKAIDRYAKRATDLVARYGGEEFAVILPNTDRAGAEQVAQAIQAEVRQLAICHDRSDVSRYVTLSLGISYVTAATDTQLEMLIATADQGLYQAKYKGRNRFCYAEIENL
ncbi:MAG: diguanylate cyclase, partial [Phormidesmis sp.]